MKRRVDAEAWLKHAKEWRDLADQTDRFRSRYPNGAARYKKCAWRFPCHPSYFSSNRVAVCPFTLFVTGRGALRSVEISSAPELVFECAGYCRISKATSDAVAATLIAPTTSTLDLYAMPRMKLVHRIQPLAEVTFRYEHFDDVRKIPLD